MTPKEIARDLMTMGDGEKADHLWLTDKNGRQLGGYSLAGLTGRLKVLLSPPPGTKHETRGASR